MHDLFHWNFPSILTGPFKFDLAEFNCICNGRLLQTYPVSELSVMKQTPEVIFETVKLYCQALYNINCHLFILNYPFTDNTFDIYILKGDESLIFSYPSS